MPPRAPATLPPQHAVRRRLGAASCLTVPWHGTGMQDEWWAVRPVPWGTWQGGTAVCPVLCRWHPPGSGHRHGTQGLAVPSVPRVARMAQGYTHVLWGVGHPPALLGDCGCDQGRIPGGTAALGTWHVAQSCSAHVPQSGHGWVPPVPATCRCLLRKELINQGPK